MTAIRLNLALRPHTQRRETGQELFEKHHSWVQDTAITIVNKTAPHRDADTKNDIRQEIVLDLWACLDHYDPSGAAQWQTWAYAAMRNRCATVVREMIRREQMQRREQQQERPPRGYFDEHAIDKSLLSQIRDELHKQAQCDAKAQYELDCRVLQFLSEHGGELGTIRFAQDSLGVRQVEMTNARARIARAMLEIGIGG